MNFLTSIFKKKESPINTPGDFWGWFQSNSSVFWQSVKTQKNINQDFFSKLVPKLNEITSGIFFLAGMAEDEVAEIIFTADGDIRNIVIVEELVKSAPTIKGWQFTALKPALSINDINVEMNGEKFNSHNIKFYPEEVLGYPDEISILVVHDDMCEQNKTTITNGVHVYIDNLLGELDSASDIDELKIVTRDSCQGDLIPISKLKEYLGWRKKEFIGKYENTTCNTTNDAFSVFNAQLESGKPLVALINTDILSWEAKGSHPWLLNIEIKFDGSKNNGMPDSKTNQLLNEIEQQIVRRLPEEDGYINIGRQTAEGIREIYFVCSEFRRPSKVAHELEDKYRNTFNIDFDIYKDKYWRSFNRFRKSKP